MSGKSIETANDAEAFKSATRSQWNLAAEGWNVHTAEIRTWLRPATEAQDLENRGG